MVTPKALAIFPMDIWRQILHFTTSEELRTLCCTSRLFLHTPTRCSQWQASGLNVRIFSAGQTVSVTCNNASANNPSYLPANAGRPYDIGINNHQCDNRAHIPAHTHMYARHHQTSALGSGMRGQVRKGKGSNSVEISNTNIACFALSAPLIAR